MPRLHNGQQVDHDCKHMTLALVCSMISSSCMLKGKYMILGETYQDLWLLLYEGKTWVGCGFYSLDLSKNVNLVFWCIKTHFINVS